MTTPDYEAIPISEAERRFMEAVNRNAAGVVNWAHAVQDRFRVELEALWAETASLAREAPYAFGSQRRARLDAAKEIARQRGLQGETLAAWQRFVSEKTASMSAYAGD